MSIATLKRKTQAKYNNSSVGATNFSLNGTLRNQGYVGQTSLSRSLPRTLMNGNTPRGHGGCCGTYQMHSIIQSAVTSLNDPNVIKNTVLSTRGLLDEKFNCIENINQPYFITCGNKTDCYNTVKPDNNQNLSNQSVYITNKAKSVIKNSALDCNKHIEKPCIIRNKCYKTNSFFNKGATKIIHTKPTSDYIPISQGEHLLKIKDKCISNDIPYIPNTNIQRTPFGSSN
jgi:hypothetical protein